MLFWNLVLFSLNGSQSREEKWHKNKVG